VTMCSKVGLVSNIECTSFGSSNSKLSGLLRVLTFVNRTDGEGANAGCGLNDMRMETVDRIIGLTWVHKVQPIPVHF